MKKFGILLAIVAAIGFWAFVQATDYTEPVQWYYDTGWTAGRMFEHVLDSSNVSGQLKRRVFTVPLPDMYRLIHPIDSTYVTALMVPPGVTFYADSLWLVCKVEGDIDSVQGYHRLLIWGYDASTATFDTFVSDMTIDAESVVTGTGLLLTRNSTSWGDGATLSAGDILIVRRTAAGPWVTAPDGYALIIKGRQDE